MVQEIKQISRLGTTRFALGLSVWRVWPQKQRKYLIISAKDYPSQSMPFKKERSGFFLNFHLKGTTKNLWGQPQSKGARERISEGLQFVVAFLEWTSVVWSVEFEICGVFYTYLCCNLSYHYDLYEEEKKRWEAAKESWCSTFSRIWEIRIPEVCRET